MVSDSSHLVATSSLKPCLRELVCATHVKTLHDVAGYRSD